MKNQNSCLRFCNFRSVQLLRRFSYLVQVGAILMALAIPSISFGACIQQAGYVQCDLLTVSQNGGQPMTVAVPAGQYLKLINNSGIWIQINQVAGVTNERIHWSEFCAYLDDFSATGQKGTPGVGEVGCTFKDIGEDYPPLQWDGIHSALSVPARSVLYLNSNTSPAAENHNYVITAYPQTSGIISYRYPQMDQVTVCNGATQSTNWTPRRNTSGRPWYVGGATVYADGGGAPLAQTSVNAACVYILNTSGAVRWSYCNNSLNVRGHLAFPTQVINNNEYLVAQATNSCSAAAGTWDYAAWLYVWY